MFLSGGVVINPVDHHGLQQSSGDRVDFILCYVPWMVLQQLTGLECPAGQIRDEVAMEGWHWHPSAWRGSILCKWHIHHILPDMACHYWDSIVSKGTFIYSSWNRSCEEILNCQRSNWIQTRCNLFNDMIRLFSVANDYLYGTVCYHHLTMTI